MEYEGESMMKEGITIKNSITVKNNIATGLMLFGFFFKIGCFTFGGGWSILAQMEQEFIEKRKLLTKGQLMDMVVVGKSIPGIMITNISMLFGYSLGGWFGGICAVLGMACPAILILTFIAMGYDSLKNNPWCNSILLGIRCAIVPIMIRAAWSLGKEILKTKLAIGICAAAFILSFFMAVSNGILIILGIAAAVLLYIHAINGGGDRI